MQSQVKVRMNQPQLMSLRGWLCRELGEFAERRLAYVKKGVLAIMDGNGLIEPDGASHHVENDVTIACENLGPVILPFLVHVIDAALPGNGC